MSWTTGFDPATSRGILTADGAIDLGGSVEAMLALAGDPRLEPGWAILVDLNAASYAPTLADAARLGALRQHAEALLGRRIAFVATAPSIQTITGLLASMAAAKGIQARAFTNGADAEQWLSEGA
ncbi:MAG TPA: hypothetical protein VF862_12865 [Gemmatimonadales bacterium]